MKITTKLTAMDKIIVLIVLLAFILFISVDIIRVHNHLAPIFCMDLGGYTDGGTKIYLGFGYKIIDYNKIDGYDGYKVGTWLLKYDNSL